MAHRFYIMTFQAWSSWLGCSSSEILWVDCRGAAQQSKAFHQISLCLQMELVPLYFNWVDPWPIFSRATVDFWFFTLTCWCRACSLLSENVLGPISAFHQCVDGYSVFFFSLLDLTFPQRAPPSSLSFQTSTSHLGSFLGTAQIYT